MVLARDKFCHAMTWAIFIDRYSWFEISSGDKQARFWGIAVDGLAYYTQKLKDFLSHRERFVVK